MQILNLFELGAAVRSARIRKGLSQSELAEVIGATQEWISRLENGRLPNPGMANVLMACNAIDLGMHLGDVPFSDEEIGADAESDLGVIDPPFLRRP